jgi:acetate kinase
VCGELGFLGLAMDEAANGRHAPVISAVGSAITVGVEPTNEEWIVASEASRLLADPAMP